MVIINLLVNGSGVYHPISDRPFKPEERLGHSSEESLGEEP